MREQAHRGSYWLREALAHELGGSTAAPPLVGVTEYDVAIVGGGYTGLWTAYALTERAPGARVVILEQDVCGGGPSGRNGGFLHGWWDQLPLLVELYGAEQALEAAWAADASVAAVEEFCTKHGVDVWLRRAGYVRTSTATVQDGDWAEAVTVCRQLGVGEQYVELGAADVRARCASPVFRGGAYMPNAATIQPARLARGLRRVLLDRGVRIHERTRVRRLRVGEVVGLDTDAGRVVAPQVVLALNAWAAGWPGFRTSLVTWGSQLVLTEPVPERLVELGWTGGEAITDSRFTVHYFRTTPDGRIAFGAGVGAAGYGGRIDGRFANDRRAAERATAALRRFFPSLADASITDAWAGPIDVSPDRLPVIGSMHGGRVHYAHGYSGNGVGPAQLAGRVLAAIVDGADDPLTRLPLVGRRPKRFPPEPFRYIGARVVREALIRHDELTDAEQRPGAVVRFLARLPRRLGYRFGPARRRRGSSFDEEALKAAPAPPED